MPYHHKPKKVYLFNNMTGSVMSKPCLRLCKKKKAKKNSHSNNSSQNNYSQNNPQ